MYEEPYSLLFFENVYTFIVGHVISTENIFKIVALPVIAGVAVNFLNLNGIIYFCSRHF